MGAPIEVDVAVLGAGPAGLSAAFEASAQGLAVAIADPQPIGGRATHHTMLPQRSLSRWLNSRQAGTLKSVGAEWRKEQKHIQRRIDAMQLRYQRRLENAGIIHVPHAAQFKDPQHLIAGDTDIHFDHAIIATGARAKTLPGPAPDGERILRPDHFWTLSQLPNSAIVVGGDSAAVELVSILQQLNCEVTWVMDEYGPLPSFDRELAEVCADLLLMRGAKLVHGKAAERITLEGPNVTVALAGGATYSAELAIIAIGDEVNVDNLGLDQLQSAPNTPLTFDLHGKTTLDGIWTAGACTGRTANTAAAEVMGRIVAQRVAGLNPPTFDPALIVQHAQATPEVAQVGLTPERAAGQAVWVETIRYDETYIGQLMDMGMRDDLKGFVRVVMDSETGIVLGGNALGPNAAELMTHVATAMASKSTAAILSRIGGPIASPTDLILRTLR